MSSPSRQDRFVVFDDPADIEAITSLPDEEMERWLLLEEHPEFKGYWLVNGFNTDFFFDLEPIIGSYCTVSPVGLDEFLTAADEAGYYVAFLDPPESILTAFQHLSD